MGNQDRPSTFFPVSGIQTLHVCLHCATAPKHGDFKKTTDSATEDVQIRLSVATVSDVPTQKMAGCQPKMDQEKCGAAILELASTFDRDGTMTEMATTV